MTEHTSSFVVAVVDDEHSILQSLEYLLESADYAVRLFTSATALLESGCLPQIDCLISDIDMPGMDGFELLRLVNAARPGLPTILITGYPDRLKRLPPLAEAILAASPNHFRGRSCWRRQGCVGARPHLSSTMSLRGVASQRTIGEC